MEEKYKIHAFYVVTIFISIIIILLAVKWTKIPDLVDYIAFALTLTSLVLAVLAIIYSMVSNESMSKVMQNLHVSSSNLKDTSREINESNRVLLQEIKLIPAAIESVNNNVSTTKSILESITLPLEKTIPAGALEPVDTLPDGIVEAFMKNSSIMGLDALYMSVLSFKTRTSFSVQDVANTIGGDNRYNYLLSYYVAIKAIGIISVTHDGKGRTIITHVHEVVLQKLEDILAQHLFDAADEMVREGAVYNGDVAEEIESWFSSTNKIREYFGESETLQSRYPHLAARVLS